MTKPPKGCPCCGRDRSNQEPHSPTCIYAPAPHGIEMQDAIMKAKLPRNPRFDALTKKARNQ